MRDISASELDRCAGLLAGLAVGDALGAGFEFGPAVDPSEVHMQGGGPFEWEPGETTDDTALAVALCRAVAEGHQFPTTKALDAVTRHSVAWLKTGPPDVGSATAEALLAAKDDLKAITSAAAARSRFEAGLPSAGNGSLMRVAPVVLAHIGEHDSPAHRQRLQASAESVSRLTHGDPLASDACVLWSAALDAAVRTGSLEDVSAALEKAVLALPQGRVDQWCTWLVEASENQPGQFHPSGFVVHALQAALASVLGTWGSPRDFASVLSKAVSCGDDADTVGAIAGALTGALGGLSSVPLSYQADLHDRYGNTASSYMRLAVLAARAGATDSTGWPLVESMLPYYSSRWPAEPALTDLSDLVPGLILGNVYALSSPEAQSCERIYSLCRLGTAQLRRHGHLEIWLTDTGDKRMDPNVALVIDELASTVLAGNGAMTFLHCVEGASRTPAAAALIVARRLGVPGPRALELVLQRHKQAVPHASPNPLLRAVLEQLAPC